MKRSRLGALAAMSALGAALTLTGAASSCSTGANGGGSGEAYLNCVAAFDGPTQHGTQIKGIAQSTCYDGRIHIETLSLQHFEGGQWVTQHSVNDQAPGNHIGYLAIMARCEPGGWILHWYAQGEDAAGHAADRNQESGQENFEC